MNHRSLLSDETVKAWYDNVAAGAKITADVYLRTIGLYCALTNETPASILKKQPIELRNQYAALVRKFESESRAQSYIVRFRKALISFLKYYDIEHKLNGIRIGGIQGTPTLINERVPTQEELRRIFTAANRQTRIALALMAFSGVRPEVLGNYQKNDGLTIGDFPEMRINNKEITFEKIPTMITVRLTLNKARKPFFTFLGDEGTFYLKQWLEERMNKGEILTARTPIFSPRFVTTGTIRKDMRYALHSAGFQWRPYVLRSYFDTQLLLAESKGLVARDYRTFWMGHTGDIENRYTTNRAKLSTEMIEDMRASYQKALRYLETNIKEEKDLGKQLNAKFLAVAGFTQSEIDSMVNYTEQQIDEAVRRKLLGARGREFVVPNTQVHEMLNRGYEFISQLGTNESILRETKYYHS